ncbi:MAG: T9SS type A sorting domain-containing protein [Chlorobi bacterium]|nr:T9SS type A sorting domain-containing protein [Chlorobiota bacterium]
MNSVLATNDGGCLLGGSKYDYENTNELERDIYILKLNNQGLLTSTEENNSNLMHEAIVFPNPGTTKFNIRVAAQYPESTVELYNINGELILKNEIIGKSAEIETSFLKTGTYIYKIYNKSGLFETGKWIKN